MNNAVPLPQNTPEALKNLFQLDSGIIFLNHGSFGATPKPIFEVFHNWQRKLESEPVAFLGREIGSYLAEARSHVAEYVHTNADDIVFIPNTTYGINCIAHALQLHSGDEVLATDHEYGACERAWRFHGAQQEIVYKKQPIPLPVVSADDFIDAFWAGVTSKTKVIFISQITSPTALIFPVREVCQKARKAGIITVVDGAHVPGQTALNITEMDPDFYAGNFHKWLCAPKGSAFLYARKDMQPLLNPLVVSWGWQSDSPGVSQFQDYFGWAGTDDPSAYLSAPAAIQFQQEYDWESVRRRCRITLQEIRANLHELLQTAPIAPDSEVWWQQMAAVPLPERAPQDLQQQLFQRYHIEVPVFKWNNQRFIRVSVQGYNSPEDGAALLNALKQILASA